MKNGTVPVITAGQMKDLASAMTQAIPSDMSRALAEKLLGNKGRLQKAVREVLAADKWSDEIPKEVERTEESKRLEESCRTQILGLPNPIQPDPPFSKPKPPFYDGACKHCRCRVSGPRACPECNVQLADQCTTCHREVAHGLVWNANIHFVGGTSARGSVAEDTDAFRKAHIQE